MSKEDQINVGEGGFEVCFRIQKKTGKWGTLGTVRFEDLGQLILAMRSCIEMKTADLNEKIREIEELHKQQEQEEQDKQKQREEILKALSEEDDSDGRG